MVMLANQPPHLVCIRGSQFPVSCFWFQNQKPDTGNLKLPVRIAIPAPRREAQEEFEHLNYSLWFQVSGFRTVGFLPYETRNQKLETATRNTSNYSF